MWTLANRGDAYAGAVGELEVEIPAQGIAAFVGPEQVLVGGRRRRELPGPRGGSRARAGRPGRSGPGRVRGGRPPPLTAVFRRRETGTYGEAPYVEEWKPLPPRLHDFVEVERPAPRGRFAMSVADVKTGLDLAEARAYAASVGARLPTEDEWQIAAEAGLLDLSGPRVWNWTESEHSDGRTRFAILKGGSDWRAEGSDWYVDGGRQEPRYSLKLLLLGGGLARSTGSASASRWTS